MSIEHLLDCLDDDKYVRLRNNNYAFKIIQNFNVGSYLSTAADEVGAENFFAQDSKLDLANVCSEVNTETSEKDSEKTPDNDVIGSDVIEDPAMVEKVI